VVVNHGGLRLHVGEKRSAIHAAEELDREPAGLQDVQKDGFIARRQTTAPRP
jgi:hypothetical protein